MAKPIHKDFPNFSVDPDNQRQHSEATSESKLSRDKTTETHLNEDGFQNVEVPGIEPGSVQVSSVLLRV